MAKTPPRYAAIKRIALSLPGASEQVFRGHWFNIGKKTFVAFPDASGRWIFKLPRDLEEMLFEVRPETFSPMIAGRLYWSYVAVENLGAAELRDFITRAWRTVAPKRLQKELPDP